MILMKIFFEKKFLSMRIFFLWRIFLIDQFKFVEWFVKKIRKEFGEMQKRIFIDCFSFRIFLDQINLFLSLWFIRFQMIFLNGGKGTSKIRFWGKFHQIFEHSFSQSNEENKDHSPPNFILNQERDRDTSCSTIFSAVNAKSRLFRINWSTILNECSSCFHRSSGKDRTFSFLSRRFSSDFR